MCCTNMLGVLRINTPTTPFVVVLTSNAMEALLDLLEVSPSDRLRQNTNTVSKLKMTIKKLLIESRRLLGVSGNDRVRKKNE
jgi:hypothetical protein